MLPLLETGESTVGVMVEVEHLAPTPPGAEVVCQARAIFVDGPVISFQLEAHEGHELIARGTHKLRMIQGSRLARRVARKSSS